VLHHWEQWKQAEKTVQKRISEYKDTDEYMQDRNDDMAWL